MNPERRRRIDALLSAALEYEEEQRASFLIRACEGDEELRKQVQQLLSAHQAEGNFRETQPADAAETIAATQPVPEANETKENRSPLEQTLPSQGEASALGRGSGMGRYIVLNKLGGGGMGVVYAAYDPELDRKVAVKLLRPEAAEGLMEPEARARLLREAQAMARLSHPNVVAVHDVGTFGKQVFIAMEYVRGQTLAKWLTEREHTAREVLEVFIQAGKGLAAAHAAGLVHRDFKPENVLIGRDGQVKVLDFGLARAAEELAGDAPTLPRQLTALGPSTPRALEAQLTKSGAFFGTPAYMAPEQLLGETTDARTDQFSFCIALYEALYGERPFEGNSVEALAQQVTKHNVKEPAKSSRVPGWTREILLRGLRPKPDERFPSMEAMLQQLGKDPRVVRRRALAAGGAMLALAAIGIGYRQVAYRQSQVCKGAEKKLAGIWDEQKKRGLSAAFLSSGKPYAQDAARAVEKALDAYTRSWVSMHTEACEATRIRGEQSEELLDMRMACLSERREELKSMLDIFAQPDGKMVANALQAAQSLSGLEDCANISTLMGPLRPPGNAQDRAKVDEVRLRLAQNKALQDAGKFSQALPLAVTIADEAKALHYRPIEAEALLRLGSDQMSSGDYKTAAQTLTEAILAAEAGGHTGAAASSWTTLVWVNGYRLGRYEEAKEQGKHALATIEHFGGDEKLLAGLYSNLGVVFNAQGKYDEALDYHQRALKLRERVFGPSDRIVAISLNSLGNVLVNQGKYAEAIASYRRAIEIDEEVLGRSHPQLATHLGSLGVALAQQGKKDEALGHFRRDLTILESALGPSHPEVAMARGNIAIILRNQGKYDEALAESRRVLEIQEKAHGPEHIDVSVPLNSIGDVLRMQGKYDQALNYFRRSLAIKEKWLGTEHPDLVFPLLGIGRAYLGLRKLPQAVEVLERAVVLRTNARAFPAIFAETRFALARALGESRREPDRARRLALEAREVLAGLGETGREEMEKIDTWLAQR